MNGTYIRNSHLVRAWRWNPASMEEAGAVVGTLLARGVPFHHPSGQGDAVTLCLGTRDMPGPLAQPGDWLVSSAHPGGPSSPARFGIVTAEVFARNFQAVAGLASPGTVQQDVTLKDREAQALLALVTAGSLEAAAQLLNRSLNTIKDQLRRARRRTCSESNLQALTVAIATGQIDALAIAQRLLQPDGGLR